MLSPALGGCFISASNAVLQVSLSSAFFSPRQIVISSALGMNALQSLSTSGVHARRWSSVPCEKERGRPPRIARPAPRATVSKASAEAASIYSGFPRSLEDPPSVVVVDTHQIGYEYTLAGARACSETSAFGAFYPATFLLLPFPADISSIGCAPAHAVQGGTQLPV